MSILLSIKQDMIVNISEPYEASVFLFFLSFFLIEGKQMGSPVAILDCDYDDRQIVHAVVAWMLSAVVVIDTATALSRVRL